MSVTASALFTAQERQCLWDLAPVVNHTLQLRIDEAVLKIGSGQVVLTSNAVLSNNAIPCLELTGFSNNVLQGIAFEVFGRFAKANATCTWQDGTTTQPSTEDRKLPGQSFFICC